MGKPIEVGDDVIIRGRVAQIGHGGSVVVLTDKKIEAYPGGTQINLHLSQVEAAELNILETGKPNQPAKPMPVKTRTAS